ncbi:hypothetical protein J2Z21_006182 [Streptomyces griseochromogenes]|uniref:Methyltransferase n=1 Tax=Streptomyces griseochromogenes TaxID=68214 RepID=A0A1B1AS47_9ACTN|nr:hypothetical protein AVL59_07045 [Streptomyces griseochromogenes]MBP2053191.1 hypothetical protein [Streptomyces griseochromogenes]
MATTAGTDWAAWPESWDRQQEWYMPDSEERFTIMLDMVEALAGTDPRVLDLACGTFEGDERVSFVTADLKDPRWTAELFSNGSQLAIAGRLAG